jgi:hypothetical protein
VEAGWLSGGFCGVIHLSKAVLIRCPDAQNTTSPFIIED